MTESPPKPSADGPPAGDGPPEVPRRILVVAPHADDEVLGCGGVMRRHARRGDQVHWLLVTEPPPGMIDAARRAAREDQIARVAQALGVGDRLHRAGLPAAGLMEVGSGRLVAALGAVFDEVAPDTLYLPFRNDAHDDHAAVFDAGWAAAKSFRRPGIRRILAYETLSETDHANPLRGPGFQPTHFADISAHLDAKLAAAAIYAEEMGAFPFPRSAEALTAQARRHGAAAGFEAAEAFMGLKWLW